ncbi:5283_t:CDS:2 [Acaulospora morrowiae]|uniref:5283_t:CDS:1 n=1 Tax=Acaulospora morrowiae TaxID=94023 RepID=A0A9N9EZS0_9GLOM|nr:5283_t:CDS:2 [Acaulospora morrowiae]
MVIKRKLRNSTTSVPTPAPEIKVEESTSLKIERRGRPRKSIDITEEVTSEKPSKIVRTTENFKIITFNPKGVGNGSKGKEKEANNISSEVSSETVYSETNFSQNVDSYITNEQEAIVSSPLSQQIPFSEDVKTHSGNSVERPKRAQPRKWIRRKVVIKTTGAEIAIPVWYSTHSNEQLNKSNSVTQDSHIDLKFCIHFILRAIYLYMSELNFEFIDDDGSVHQVSSQISRYLMKPPIIYHPKSILFSSTIRHQEHYENFNQLSTFALYFQRNELWEELHFLERLYYKNKNQHKRAIYFRKIEEVRRIVHRFKEMEIGDLLSEFVKLFYGHDQEKQRQNRWDYVPSRVMGFHVLNRLNCAILLMDRALGSYLDAYT